MENAAEGSGVEFWMLGGVDARLKIGLFKSSPKIAVNPDCPLAIFREFGAS
jgi:hypothetical protein